MNKLLRYLIITACIILPLTIVTITTLEGRPAHILWFCYTGVLLIGIGTILKNGNIIAVEANILILPLITWLLDFTTFNLTGNQIFGQVNYGFIGETLLTKVLVIQHIITIPVIIFLLWHYRPTGKNLWLFSIAQAIVMNIIIRLATTSEYNVNCVYYSCANNLSFGKWYFLVWIVAIILITKITDYAIGKLFKTSYKKFISKKAKG